MSTQTITIFQAIVLLFQSKEGKEDDDEEEEEKEVASMEENYPYDMPKLANKKNPRLSVMGFQMYALRGILQLLCKMEFDNNT